jgi:hypothetical protein
MKRVIALAGIAAGLSMTAMAADVTGYIIDEMCSKDASMRGNVECAQKCIKGGSPAVLVTDDGKIYKISNQAKVVPDAGKKVTLSGNIKGDTITVSKISAL